MYFVFVVVFDSMTGCYCPATRFRYGGLRSYSQCLSAFNLSQNSNKKDNTQGINVKSDNLRKVILKMQDINVLAVLFQL